MDASDYLRLEKLAALHQAGALSDEEFSRAKTGLLGATEAAQHTPEGRAPPIAPPLTPPTPLGSTRDAKVFVGLALLIAWLVLFGLSSLFALAVLMIAPPLAALFISRLWRHRPAATFAWGWVASGILSLAIFLAFCSDLSSEIASQQACLWDRALTRGFDDPTKALESCREPRFRLLDFVQQSDMIVWLRHL